MREPRTGDVYSTSNERVVFVIWEDQTGWCFQNIHGTHPKYLMPAGPISDLHRNIKAKIYRFLFNINDVLKNTGVLDERT